MMKGELIDTRVVSVGSLLDADLIHRVQSPSSINTFRQCPRKYYYLYHEGLPCKPSIHLVKGSVVHSVLEDFFDVVPGTAGYRNELRINAARLLKMHWLKKKSELDVLGLPDIQDHFMDAAMMVSNWTESFIVKLRKLVEAGQTLDDAFAFLVPIREMEYRSDEYAVRGFIDAIEERNGKVRVMDYKTSKRNHISDEYFLQLSIYALLYKLKHGRLPDEVGLNFLRHGEKCVEATEKMVDHAIKEINVVHSSTSSKDINDYPKKPGPLCKWRTGACDFYEQCFGAGKY